MCSTSTAFAWNLLHHPIAQTAGHDVVGYQLRMEKAVTGNGLEDFTRAGMEDQVRAPVGQLIQQARRQAQIGLKKEDLPAGFQ